MQEGHLFQAYQHNFHVIWEHKYLIFLHNDSSEVQVLAACVNLQTGKEYALMRENHLAINVPIKSI